MWTTCLSLDEDNTDTVDELDATLDGQPSMTRWTAGSNDLDDLDAASLHQRWDGRDGARLPYRR